jgi:hypothetical protein
MRDEDLSNSPRRAFFSPCESKLTLQSPRKTMSVAVEHGLLHRTTPTSAYFRAGIRLGSATGSNRAGTNIGHGAVPEGIWDSLNLCRVTSQAPGRSIPHAAFRERNCR